MELKLPGGSAPERLPGTADLDNMHINYDFQPNCGAATTNHFLVLRTNVQPLVLSHHVENSSPNLAPKPQHPTYHHDRLLNQLCPRCCAARRRRARRDASQGEPCPCTKPPQHVLKNFKRGCLRILGPWPGDSYF